MVIADVGLVPAATQLAEQIPLSNSRTRTSFKVRETRMRLFDLFKSQKPEPGKVLAEAYQLVDENLIARDVVR